MPLPRPTAARVRPSSVPTCIAARHARIRAAIPTKDHTRVRIPARVTVRAADHAAATTATVAAAAIRAVRLRLAAHGTASRPARIPMRGPASCVCREKFFKRKPTKGDSSSIYHEKLRQAMLAGVFLLRRSFLVNACYRVFWENRRHVNSRSRRMPPAASIVECRWELQLRKFGWMAQARRFPPSPSQVPTR
jgi:hypothetical protein